MDKLLVAAGIIIIIFVFWKDWTRESTLQKEKEDGRLLLGELADARREVQILLEQLETVSEKIVDEISYGLEEIKIQVSSAVEKRTDVEESDADTREGKTGSSRVVKRLRSGKAAVSGQTAGSKRQREKPKNEQNSSPGKDTYEKDILPKHKMVYAMADMGHTEEDIAKQMKIGKGEVTLLLQLRQKGVEDSV